jgi:hypothetical protein
MARKTKPQWDAAPKEPRADSKLKRRPPEEQDAWWELRNPTEPDTKPWTLEALAVHIQEELGIDVSLRAVSEWQSWYATQRRLERAAERAEQVKLELAKDPRLTPQDLARAGQVVFMNEAMETGNVKAYVQLAKLQLASDRQALERDKLSIASKSKLEAGLDALAAELKGNPRAAKIFADLKTELSKA